jgi:hypothetical protein
MRGATEDLKNWRRGTTQAPVLTTSREREALDWGLNPENAGAQPESKNNRPVACVSANENSRGATAARDLNGGMRGTAQSALKSSQHLEP